MRCAVCPRGPCSRACLWCSVPRSGFRDICCVAHALDSLPSFPPSFSPFRASASLRRSSCTPPTLLLPIRRTCWKRISSCSLLGPWHGTGHHGAIYNAFRATTACYRSSCVACNDGLVSEAGATVCTLEPGFWRTSNSECLLSKSQQPRVFFVATVPSHGLRCTSVDEFVFSKAVHPHGMELKIHQPSGIPR